MPNAHIVRAVCRTLHEIAPPGAGVLDLSCGEGDILASLDADGFQVDGTHFRDDDYILRSPNPVLQRVNIHTGVDLTRPLPLPDAGWDVVLATEVIEHLPEHPRFLQEVSRVLRPGGCFLFTTPNAHRLSARVHFLLTGTQSLHGARPGWHVPAEGLYATHHHPVDLSIFQAQLYQAGFSGLRMGMTQWSHGSLAWAWATPLFWAGTWIGTRRQRREHPEGGRDLCRCLCAPGTLFSDQLLGVVWKRG